MSLAERLPTVSMSSNSPAVARWGVRIRGRLSWSPVYVRFWNVLIPGCPIPLIGRQSMNLPVTAVS